MGGGGCGHAKWVPFVLLAFFFPSFIALFGGGNPCSEASCGVVTFSLVFKRHFRSFWGLGTPNSLLVLVFTVKGAAPTPKFPIDTAGPSPPPLSPGAVGGFTENPRRGRRGAGGIHEEFGGGGGRAATERNRPIEFGWGGGVETHRMLEEGGDSPRKLPLENLDF